jgi:hypothetical protein
MCNTIQNTYKNYINNLNKEHNKTFFKIILKYYKNQKKCKIKQNKTKQNKREIFSNFFFPLIRKKSLVWVHFVTPFFFK